MRRERVYRALLRAYPSSFRREYADAMTQHFADRARRDGRRRAWTNALRDASISAPYEHWETFMNGSSQSKLVGAAVVTGAAALVFLLVGGAILAAALLLLLGWQIYAIMRVRGHQAPSVRWWKFLASGATLFAVLFLIFAPPWPESWRSSVDGSVAWSVAMLGFSTAIVLVVTGLLMGAAQWATRRHQGTAS